VIKQYHPAMIGVASTCLAEHWEDVAAQIKEFYLQSDGWCPELILRRLPAMWVPITTDFTGQSSRLSQHWQGPEKRSKISIFLPNMISPADIRYLREMCSDFSLDATILPDYSETLGRRQLGGISPDPRRRDIAL